jgi:hypothetical protein
MSSCTIPHERTLEIFKPQIPLSNHLSEENWQRLALHFFQGQDDFDFAMSMLLKEGTSSVKKSKTVTYLDAIQSTWKSLTRTVPRPFAAVPYCTSETATTTWACIDVDNHHSQPSENSHALWLLRKLVAGIETAIIDDPDAPTFMIEDSGRGFHIFLISVAPKPVRSWLKSMRSILKCSGVDEKRDGIELFPVTSGKRKGVRLPGSANANTWRAESESYKVSELIAVSGLAQLLAAIPSLEQLSSRFNKRGSSFLLKERTETRSDAPAHWSTHTDAIRVLEKHAIKSVSSRRNRLASLVGDGIHHFAKPVLWEIAQAQYRSARPSCQSALQTHLDDFESLYADMMTEMLKRFTSAELAYFETLKSISRQTTFLIAWNFSQLAHRTKRFGPDGRFPLSGLDLSWRMQRGMRNSYYDRNFLVGTCIKKVSTYVKGKRPEHFVWTLNDDNSGS